jgi:hypothetical protein
MLGRQTPRMESARPYRAPRRHIAPAVAHNTTNAKVVNDKHTQSEGHLIPTSAGSAILVMLLEGLWYSGS